MADSQDTPPELTPADDSVFAKYKLSGKIVNDVLKLVIAKCVAGASVKELCEFGDNTIIEKTTSKGSKKTKDPKSKEVKKGIAFPTCVSVNNCMCHFSPLKSEADVLIKDGDMVKIDLGVHNDGYIAVAAHTLVIGATVENKVKGRAADVMMAAHMASEAALKLVSPGKENYTVTDSIQKVTEYFKCKPVEGILSHQLKKHVIDGEKGFIQNPSEAQRREHEKSEFEVHEVYAVDVLVTTGEGKGKEMEARTTVYKRKDIEYQLKMKASRQFFSETEKRFGSMPFALRLCEDEKKAKIGVVECVKHGLMQPFNVLYEKEGELVAQYKFTVMLMPKGPVKITGLRLDTSVVESEYTVEDPELKALIAQPLFKKGPKNKKEVEKEITECISKAAEAEAPTAAAATPTTTAPAATPTTTAPTTAV